MVYRVVLLVGLAFACCVNAANNKRAQSRTEMSAYELETARIENEKLKIERLKAEAELRNAQAALQRAKIDQEGQKIEWLKGVGTILAVAVPVGALIFSIYSLRKSVEAQTLTKLGEIAMEGHSPVAVLNRAKLLTKFYSKALPPDFEATLDGIKADEAGRSGAAPEVVTTRTSLIGMLAEYPAQRKQILSDWLTVWPNDEWAKKL